MKIYTKILTGIFCAFLFFNYNCFTHEAFYGPTETIYWDESKAFTGYTLFGTGGTTYLIDMEGKVVHTWKTGTNPRLTPSGTVYDAAGGDPSKSTTWKELDWNGNVIWQYTENRSNYHPHHDFEKIYNPKLGDSTFIYIANKDLTVQQCLDAGGDSTQTKGYSGAQVDAIVEVDMQGNIIWEWWFFDHIVQELYSSKPNYGVVKNNPGKININIKGNTLKSDWLHSNSLDYNEELDQIVINSVHGEFYVIDHGNTFIKGDPASSIALAASSKGDFLYRFGDPAKYGQGDPPSILDNWEKATNGHKQIGGSHNIQWIKPGLQGAGNFLIFNNGQNLFELTGQSYIFEINPYLNSAGTNTGVYVNPPTAGYNVVSSPDKDLMKEKKNISKQVVWSFSSKNNGNFFSTIGSGTQRLPNGNTLICSDVNGHIFEVCPKDTSVVWEYIIPTTKNGIKKVLSDNYPMFNSAFRAYRYSADYPGLKGRDLTGKTTITGRTPDFYTPEDLLTSIEMDGDEATHIIESSGSYPNPFNPSTSICFSNEKEQNIDVKIYDSYGKYIKTLFSGYTAVGIQNLSWDGTNDMNEKAASGVYYFVITSEQQTKSGQMILIK